MFSKATIAALAGALLIAGGACASSITVLGSAGGRFIYDGKDVGSVPLRLTKVPPGRHQVRVVTPDGRVRQFEVDVPADGNVNPVIDMDRQLGAVAAPVAPAAPVYADQVDGLGVYPAGYVEPAYAYPAGYGTPYGYGDPYGGYGYGGYGYGGYGYNPYIGAAFLTGLGFGNRRFGRGFRNRGFNRGFRRGGFGGFGGRGFAGSSFSGRGFGGRGFGRGRGFGGRSFGSRGFGGRGFGGGGFGRRGGRRR